MARARGRTGRSPDYEWFAMGGKASAVDLAAATASLGPSALAVSGPGTLVRLRGQVFLQLDAGAVDERVLVCFGIIIVSNEAFAAGVASVPKPFTDADADWMWHGFLSVTSGAETGIVSDFLVDRVLVDSKAMRKVKSSQTLIFVAEVASSQDAAGTFDYMYGIRILGAS